MTPSEEPKEEVIIPPSEQFVSMRTACATFDVTAQTIRRWIKSGQMRAIMVEGKWRINRQSMIDFANERWAKPGG